MGQNEIMAKATLGEITDNFDDLKIRIQESMEPYKGLVFTDATIKDAKSTKADLNKMVTSLETERKRIKKVWNEPYLLFESKVKDLVGIIKEPMDEIDSQVQDFEIRRKEAKKCEVSNALTERLGAVEEEYNNIVSLCGISYDEKWLNSTVSMKKVNEEIQSQIDAIISDIKSLQVLCEGDDMLEDLLSAYQSTKNLSETIQKRSSILAQREAYKKMEEVKAERARQAEEAKSVVQDPVKEEVVEPMWTPGAAAEAVKIEPVVEEMTCFKVTVKKSESWDMMQFFDHHKINFEIWEGCK